METQVARYWQVWVDTGGTFTDCLAVGPSGTLHRAKVLSSSALRGVVQSQISPTHLRVDEKWGAPQDFVRGFALRLLDREHGPTTVERYDPGDRLVQLTHSLPPGIAPGTAFEVRSPEEPPVLAARLVTQTPANAPLPPLQMRVATTRGTNALLTRAGAPTALFTLRLSRLHGQCSARRREKTTTTRPPRTSRGADSRGPSGDAGGCTRLPATRRRPSARLRGSARAAHRPPRP